MRGPCSFRSHHEESNQCNKKRFLQSLYSSSSRVQKVRRELLGNSSNFPQNVWALIANFTSANARLGDGFENYRFIKRILSLKEAYVWGRFRIGRRISHTRVALGSAARETPKYGLPGMTSRALCSPANKAAVPKRDSSFVALSQSFNEELCREQRHNNTEQVKV